MLREHKRRVVGYIENTIPEFALDMGTSVMVMQTKCKTPGCVPLETSVVIVFPRDGTQYMEGVKESQGGTFKTTILLPLSEVTLDDVLDSLPPQFEGGRKTWEKTCLTLRDFVLGRIGGTVGIGETGSEKEDRQVLSHYLIACLEDYVKSGCQAPKLGMPFPNERSTSLNENRIGLSDKNGIDTIALMSSKTKEKEGHFRLQGTNDNNEIERSDDMNKSVPEPSNLKQTETAMDWRRRQNMSQMLQLPDSNHMIRKLTEREHFCTRNSSCPCCEPSSIQDISNAMMSL